MHAPFEYEIKVRALKWGVRLKRDSWQMAVITIPTDKSPALLEDSQCFTYAEALPECFHRSKPCTQETFHDDRHE